jgi:hypothetical protein
MNATPAPNATADIIGGFLFLLMVVVALGVLAFYAIHGARNRRRAAELDRWYNAHPSDAGQSVTGGIRCEWFGTCWNHARFWRLDSAGERVPICGACNERANRVSR